MGDPNSKPNVPKGWVAVWDDKYQEWFYVNEATGKSQWDAPKDTTPAISPPPYVADEKEQAGSGLNYPSVGQDKKYSGTSYGRKPVQQPQYQQYPQQRYQQQQQYLSQQQYPPQQYQPQPYYGQQQVVYQQAAPKKSSRFGGGMGMGLLGGAALGGLGGLLMADAMTPDYGGGGDFGGGDFGGGEGDFGGF